MCCQCFRDVSRARAAACTTQRMQHTQHTHHQRSQLDKLMSWRWMQTPELLAAGLKRGSVVSHVSLCCHRFPSKWTSLVNNVVVRVALVNSSSLTRLYEAPVLHAAGVRPAILTVDPYLGGNRWFIPGNPGLICSWRCWRSWPST